MAGMAVDNKDYRSVCESLYFGGLWFPICVDLNVWYNGHVTHLNRVIAVAKNRIIYAKLSKSQKVIELKKALEPWQIWVPREGELGLLRYHICFQSPASLLEGRLRVSDVHAEFIEIDPQRPWTTLEGQRLVADIVKRRYARTAAKRSVNRIARTTGTAVRYHAEDGHWAEIHALQRCARLKINWRRGSKPTILGWSDARVNRITLFDY